MNATRSIIFASLLCGSTGVASSQIGTTKQLSLSPPTVPQKLPPAKQEKPNKATQVVSLKYREGEVIVKYKSGIKKSTINSLSSTQGFEVVKTYSKLTKKNLITVLKSTKTTQEMIKLLKADPNVESVSPNYIRQLDAEPNDPDFSRLWGMNNTGQTGGISDADIDAVEAWDITTGTSEVVAVVFDTGIDYTHNDIKPNLWINQAETPGDGIDNDSNGYIDDIYGADVATDANGTNDGDPLDIHGHGTHVSGTIGAKGNDGFGIAGVNWDVKIMELKVFRPDLLAYNSDILEAIEYVHTMKERGVNIVAINASYGGYGGDQTDPMNDAIQGLGDAGIIFCASAGNDTIDNDDSPHFPSSYNADNIIAIASTDHIDDISLFSNYGATSVDLAAPGSSIYSTMKYTMDNYTPQSGDLYFEGIDGTESWVGVGDWFYNFDVFNTGDRSISDGSITGDQYSNNDFKHIGQGVDLSSMTDPNLVFGFYAKIDIEPDFDALQLYFYTEETGWKFVNSWDGWDQSMQSYSVEIPEEFRKESFAYTLALNTDVSITGDGVYIDDIGIGIGTRTSDRYETWSGTSMATPHVTGAVALLSGPYAGSTVADMKARILDNVDPLDSLTSYVLTGGRLNLKSAMGTGGICHEGYHRKQGTLNCIVDTVPEFTPPYLPDYAGLIQGTTMDDPNAMPDTPLTLALPTCGDEGLPIIQGTDTCPPTE